jgi:hypothetical protein
LGSNRPGDFYTSMPHRTFAWYVLMILNGLEESIRPRKPNLSDERADAVRTAARQVVAAMRTQFLDDPVLPKPALVRQALWDITPTKLAFERLSYYLVTELQSHLSAALKTERSNRTQKRAPRRPARKRSELPDPTQPAWASVNQMSAKKVQIPCRIEPQLKALIEEEAEKHGVSQSRWLEEAIAEKLQRQGHAVELPKAAKPPIKKKSGKPRRTQRASYPNPGESPDAHDNRADYSTSTRMEPRLAAEIDKIRGKQDRSSWLNDAIMTFLDEKAQLPGPLKAEQPQTVAFGVRFDREFYPVVKAAKENSGLTLSEWYRRVARWYLARNQ